jgi:predicted AlkP superfamily phosphohydrolase/phosphomutase
MSGAPLAKVVVIGIDAASPDLVRRWAADGSLPNLRSLSGRGLVGATESVEGFFVGSTWPSFATGVSPARHGLHYLRQLRVGSYQLYRPADGPFVRQPAFWKGIGEAGRRVAILDVPLTRVEPVNGIQLVEWGGHDAVFGFRARPEPLADQLIARWGPHPLRAACDAIERSESGYRSFLEALERGIEIKANLTIDLLERGGWDLFLQVFTESHCAGHQCWHLHDRAHPAHDPALVARLGDPLRRVYSAIDRAIGRIVDRAGDALVVVLAAHGMSHWFGAQFLLPEILARLGGFVPSTPTDPEPPILGAARTLWRRLPEPIRRQAAPLRDWLRRGRPLEAATLAGNAARSRCFPHPNGLAVGGIRLNLAGREPAGIVDPSQSEELAEWLAGELTAIIDLRTGQPAIRRVIRTATLYSGPFLDELPDLLVEWDDRIATGSSLLGGGAGATVRLQSPAIGLIEGVNDYGRSGEHRSGGLFIAAGPGISAGRSAATGSGAGRPERTVSILDFAPTFARKLGVELAGLEGQPIAELLG